MIATISPASNQYHHTINTLKYADRAKEIRTHIQKNIGTINAHVSDYQKMIENLQSEVSRLRKELAEKESQLNARPTEKAVNYEMPWLNALSQETSENIQERINLQKALIELEETNLRNREELQHLDDAILKQQIIEDNGVVVQALQARRRMILDNIRDNDELGISYQKEIEANEKQRCQLHDMIDEAIRNNGNKTYLGILSQYRLLGIYNTELQLEMAKRDQIIYSQREAHRNLWNLLMSLGLDEKQIVEIARKKGISIENWMMTTPLGPSSMTHYPDMKPQIYCSPFSSQSGAVSHGFLPHVLELSSRTTTVQNRKLPHAVFCEEHHSSRHHIPHRFSPSHYQQCCSNQLSSCFSAQDQHPHAWCNPFPQLCRHIPPYDESGHSTSSFMSTFRQMQ